MILTAAQRMALQLGLGRAVIKEKEWDEGVMVYAIDKKFGEFNSITVPIKNSIFSVTKWNRPKCNDAIEI